MILRTQAARRARALLVLFLCGIAAFAQAQAADWQFIRLGTLAGSQLSIATAVTNQGDVGGYSLAPSPTTDTMLTHSFTWSNGTMVDTGFPAGSSGITVMGMNDNGDMVGMTSDQHGAARINGRWIDFGYIGELRSVNRYGVAVGRVIFGHRSHAVFMKDGATQRLGRMGGFESVANAINDNAQIVGYFIDEVGASHGFLWDGARIVDLGAGLGFMNAVDINNYGEILTVSRHGEDRFVTSIIRGGVSQALNLGPGDFLGHALNDRGDVLGVMMAPGANAWHGFLYADGVLTDLEQLPQVASSGLTQLNPAGMNERRWIVGWGYDAQKNYQAFLLVPR